MKAVIVLFPGTNRENDMAAALAETSGTPPEIVWHGDSDLPKADLIVLPGGFAYGDYLRCGAMAAHSPIMRAVVERARRGTPVLGVCNGFQILTESGLLPGALMRNGSLKFVCRDVHLKVENNQTLFANRLEAGQVMRVPVAHGDGNYFADEDTLDRLEDEGRIAFRYCAPGGEDGDNPNGSIRSIAGIYNETKTVLGLMPHPENAMDAAMGSADGRPLFEGIAAALS
ncbi:MAG: phosphoribosylformylglycinamidine synthase subunit PurQ [Rhodospirillaceae bacterium]|nr:phosphoribosylformylglycinamidine synthase subunit PurQ [Rhodospirillaceae bacterium]